MGRKCDWVECAQNFDGGRSWKESTSKNMQEMGEGVRIGGWRSCLKIVVQWRNFILAVLNL
jgi:hypothetical protein